MSDHELLKLIVSLCSQSRAAEERERELREKLEELEHDMQGVVSNLSHRAPHDHPQLTCSKCRLREVEVRLRALLASHWPAHPPKTETPGQ